jgi:type III restriction enzyme
MPKSIIAYDKDLPEIPGRCAWEKPASYLVKDASAPTGWRVEDSGRRRSELLIISKLREAVDGWREGDPAKGIEPYVGISDVTRRLLEYWFQEDHGVEGFRGPFRYHFCQREAIETLIYLVEVLENRDCKDLIKGYAKVFKRDLFSDNVTFQETMDGRRQIRRFVAELNAEGVQDLPPKDLRRYAFKMATGSGKTWVMAMAVVWSRFHKLRVPDSELSTNFLVIAPNVIVYQRLEKDFADNDIFNALPLVPPEWRPWNQKVILRGDSIEPDPSGNLFLTNIHQIYEAREQPWTPKNALDALLGQKPVKDLAAYQQSMLARIKELKDLVVLNDEAHHVHDKDLAWSKSLLNIHASLPEGLSLWLDFSATPKDQNGMYYPWTVCDYPLAQAIEDRIVKSPIIVTKEDDPKLPATDPEHVTKENVVEKYGYWLYAAVGRWKEHYATFKKLGIRPVLFIMAEKNLFADAIGQFLWQTKDFGFKEKEILIIHTDEAGEITKKDLEKARQVARDIDKKESTIKAIVSVMMLREGWDVRNVSVVLGLRPFTAKAEILPEQVIGRGLRLMTGVGPDNIQPLEVLGTRNLLKVVREQLEADGVGVTTTTSDPPKPVTIEPILDRKDYDIVIPITKPRLSHDVKKLVDLDPDSFDPIYEREELDEIFRIDLKLTFMTTETEVHQAALALPIAEHLLSSITNKVTHKAGLTNVFSELLPKVRMYVRKTCFGREIDIESEVVRSHLNRIELQEGIAAYLARKISELTIEKRDIEFEKADFRLSETKPFHWRRNLPPLEAGCTIFNYVATYNDFERNFAEFLDKAADVKRFASLGTTEQGESGTQFRIDYLKPNGAIGFYHPDWVVVQETADEEVNWIIETKGRIWEDTKIKDEAMGDWCARVSEQSDMEWRYNRVDQSAFKNYRGSTIRDLVESPESLLFGK